MYNSKKFHLILIIVSILTLIFFATAIAGEISVPEDYPTIQGAIDTASSGDIISVGPGTYEEKVDLSGKTDLTLKSTEGPDETLIKGTVYLNNSNGITIEGFTITAPKYDGIYVNAGGAKDLKIMGNIITQGINHGVNFEAATYSDILIEDNKINGNGFDGIRLLGKGNHITIRGNQIKNNGARDARGVGIRIGKWVTNVTIEDNVITGNAFANIHPA